MVAPPEAVPGAAVMTIDPPAIDQGPINQGAIDPESAASTLTDVERVERRTREALLYAGSSAFLIMWGVLTLIGHLVEHFMPERAIAGWVTISVLGVAGGFGIAWHRRRSRQQDIRNMRLLCAQIALLVYGLLWVLLFGSHTVRQLQAFWPSLWMFGFYLISGVTVTLMIVGGYLWIGEYFDLWVAVWTTGALIAGGLWLRRASLAR
jgi:hypothetical protein